MKHFRNKQIISKWPWSVYITTGYYIFITFLPLTIVTLSILLFFNSGVCEQFALTVAKSIGFNDVILIHENINYYSARPEALVMIAWVGLNLLLISFAVVSANIRTRLASANK